MASRRRRPAPQVLEPAQLAQLYQNTFSSESGSAVLVDLRKRFGRRNSFTRGEPDTTAFNEGQRSVYLLIMDFLDVTQTVPEDNE